MKTALLSYFGAALLLAPISLRAQCKWVGFDTSRINYSAGTLEGTAHSQLRGLITANGGTVAPGLKTLTLQNLLQHQVFYTSLLNRSTGGLSATEKQAVQTFVRAGGTLIVTGDIYTLNGYDDFTSWLGVTGWTALTGCRVPGVIKAPHPITAGITSFQYCTNGTFTVPATAKLLADDNANNPFLAVVEGAPSIAGRVLVVGDHNMFTDSFLPTAQNKQMATNMVKWACTRGCATASWSNYGAGWPGTSGIPTLTASANPVLGQSTNLLASNSSGQTSAWVLTLGFKQISVPSPWDGTLLASLDVLFTLPLPSRGATVPFAIPGDNGLCGAQLYMQGVQLDGGASKGLAFSPGLQLSLGR